MPKNARFWRNVTLIGLAHVALIIGLVRWSRETRNASAQSVVWMNGGAGDGNAPEAKMAPSPKPRKAARPRIESTPEPLRKEDAEEEQPVLTSAPSEIQLPTPKPSPRSTSAASPARTPKATATPKLKVTPKPTPKPKRKSAPKPSPKKMILTKASPSPSAKAKPTAEEEDKDEEQPDVDAEKRKIAEAAPAKNDASQTDSTEKPAKKSNTAEGAKGKGTSPGDGGHAGGAPGASQFGWYGSMLHDRFYSEWVQPTTVASSSAKFSVLVKLRIQTDGRVSSFEIIKPSGNAEVDESVSAVAKRVTQVDPLPAGLGNGDHYDVKINFELNSEQ
jgi:TonB family protein